MQNFSSELAKLCFQNAGINIQPFKDFPQMLIGQDHCDMIITREFKILSNSNLILSNSLLGWSIHGCLKVTNSPEIYNISVVNEPEKCNLKCHQELNKILKTYFELDSIGVQNNIQMNPDDNQALEILRKTSKYKGNHWEVGLIWKVDNIKIPNSRPTALRRLHLLERKLDRDKNYAAKYYREMERLFENHFAKLAEKSPSGNRVWYLPHFGVENVNKPDKVRLVFDAAAKSAGVSFNDLLLTGPDLLRNLLGVIMRFRQKPYAIKADMRDMFLKIKIIPDDHDAQRFLWRGSDRQNEPKEYIMTSLLFGAKSSPSTALFIKNENANNFSSRFPDSAKSIVGNCYMDDFLDSCDSPEEARERIREVTLINKAANWEMHSSLSGVICSSKHR